LAPISVIVTWSQADLEVGERGDHGSKNDGREGDGEALGEYIIAPVLFLAHLFFIK
jgi:hypothetical protein